MKNESDNVTSASVAPLRNMDFYRSIPAGTALIETLNEMVDEGLLSKEDAWSLLTKYDENVQQCIRKNTSLQPGIVFNKAAGHLANFNHIRDLWTIEADNLLLQVGDVSENPERVRILCMHEK